MKLDLVKLIQDDRVVKSSVNLKEALVFVEINDKSWYDDNKEVLKNYSLTHSKDMYSVFIEL